MDKEIQDFFAAPNLLLTATPQEKINVKADLKLSEAVSRILGCGIYVADYTKNEVVYISENIAKMCGLPYKEITAENCGLYLKHVPDSDYKMLLEINGAVFSLFKTMTDEEILKCCVSYNFHINHLLLHQSFTPIAVDNGFVRLGLFVLTLSSENKLGHIVLQQKNSKTFYEYSLEKHVWIPQEKITLSETEKQILCLSAQGRTEDEIAGLLCKSTDSIKYHKKVLFKKLNVSNITEALIYAINNRFF